MVKVAVVEGDGIGREVVPVARDILAAVRPDIEFFDVEVGYGRWERTGERLRRGDDRRPPVGRRHPLRCGHDAARPGYRSVLLQIRHALDLYANVRPIRGEGVDVVIVRENTEGLYSGIEWTEPDRACTVRVVSRRGERADRPLRLPPPREVPPPPHRGEQGERAEVGLPLRRGLHRGGRPGGGFLPDELHRRALPRPPDAPPRPVRRDRDDQHLRRHPLRRRRLPGGGARNAPEREHRRTACPLRARPRERSRHRGQKTSQTPPVAAIQSAAMLLEHLGDPASAAVVEEAVDRVLRAGIRTPDLGGVAGTREFGAAVLREVGRGKA